MKYRVTGLCEGNPVVTGGFATQQPSNANGVFTHDVIMQSYFTGNDCHGKVILNDMGKTAHYLTRTELNKTQNRVHIYHNIR